MNSSKMFDAMAQIDERLIDRSIKRKSSVINDAGGESSNKHNYTLRKVIPVAVSFVLIAAVSVTAVMIAYFSKPPVDLNPTDQSIRAGFDFENNQTVGDTAQESGKDDSAETSTSTDAPAENDEVSGSEIVSDIPHEEIHEPPETLVFKNLEDLCTFIALADSSDEDVEEYRSEHPEAQLFIVKELRDISEKIKKSDIPKPEFFNADINEFGGTYYSNRSELDLVCIIDGIRYRFVYSYDKPEHSYNGNAVEKCTFANHEFDLYEGDGCFVGSIYADYATIRITIYCTDFSIIRQMIV